MPPRGHRPCRHRGCAALTNDGTGFCATHQAVHASDGWSRYQPGKSRQERGYGRPWEIRRARILDRDKHICQACRRDGIAAKATTVDHIVAKARGGTDEDSNLEALCWPCHRRKTAKERLI